MATSGGKQCCLGTVNWPIEKRERPDAFRSLIQYLPVLQAQTLSTRLIEIQRHVRGLGASGMGPVNLSPGTHRGRSLSPRKRSHPEALWAEAAEIRKKAKDWPPPPQT
jgi:hypothetical protein